MPRVRTNASIPVLVGSQLITALQSIVSRNVDPLESAVISICEFHAGNARNVIPQTAELNGTVRTLTPEVRELVEKRVHEVVRGRRADDRRQDRPDLRARLSRRRSTMPTQTDYASAGGEGRSPATPDVHDMPPLMGAEDFAYMLESAARRVHLLRQRRQRRAASPRL